MNTWNIGNLFDSLCKRSYNAYINLGKCGHVDILKMKRNETEPHKKGTVTDMAQIGMTITWPKRKELPFMGSDYGMSLINARWLMLQPFIDTGWVIKKFQFALSLSALSRLPRIEIFLIYELQTKYYLWASFEDNCSMSKLSKFDIQMAISAI